jgi:hypothetical protein
MTEKVIWQDALQELLVLNKPLAMFVHCLTHAEIWYLYTKANEVSAVIRGAVNMVNDFGVFFQLSPIKTNTRKSA